MEKIPVNIISGFLGSGKTTAIIKLLNGKENDEQWAVIINEFGKISIDSQTLRSSTQSGMVFEISGGCICCSAKRYFKENLEKILLDGNYSRIIIEPTGLGGVDTVSEVVNANPGLKLMPIVCLVDIAIVDNPRLQLIPIYTSQISKANIIAFSKCDLLTDVSEQNRLIEKFKSLFPEKKFCINALDFDLFSSVLYMESDEIAEGIKFRMLTSSDRDLTDGNFQQKNYSFGKELIINTEDLTLFFKNHPAVLRAKGHVQTEKGWNLFNFTLSGCSYTACQAKELNEIILILENPDAKLIEDIEIEIDKTFLLNPLSKVKIPNLSNSVS